MTLTTGHPHGRNCICESCLKAIGLTRTLRIVEPDGTEQLSSPTRSCRLVYPDGHEEIIPIGATRLSYDNIGRWRACPPERFEHIRELCGYVEDGSSTSVTISQDDATREWCVRVGKIAYYGGSLTAAFNLAVRDNE